jgi:hypothetical protein
VTHHAEKLIAMRQRIVGAHPFGQQRSVGVEPLQRQQGQQVARVLFALTQQALVGSRTLLFDGAVFDPAFRGDHVARFSIRLRYPELLVRLLACFLQHCICVFTRPVDDQIRVGFHRSLLVGDRLVGVAPFLLKPLIGVRAVGRRLAGIAGSTGIRRHGRQASTID